MDGWHAFSIALGALGLILWWLFRRTVNSLEQCVNKQDLKDAITELKAQTDIQRQIREDQHRENRGEFKDLRSSIDTNLKEIYGQLDDQTGDLNKIAVQVAEIRGRLASEPPRRP